MPKPSTVQLMTFPVLGALGLIFFVVDMTPKRASYSLRASPVRMGDLPSVSHQEGARLSSQAPSSRTRQPSLAPVTYRECGLSAPTDRPGTKAQPPLPRFSGMPSRSLQAVFQALDNAQPLNPDDVQIHDILQSFSYTSLAPTRGERVHLAAELIHTKTWGTLLLAPLRGHKGAEQRSASRNVTFIVDRSRHMANNNAMERVRAGLLRATAHLKDKDVLNLLLVDEENCAPVEGFVMGRDSLASLFAILASVTSRNTDFQPELIQIGQQFAREALNRRESAPRLFVFAGGTELVEPFGLGRRPGLPRDELIPTTLVTLQGIKNEPGLRRLAERLQGTHVHLGSLWASHVIFGHHFESLTETVGVDVRFNVTPPDGLTMEDKILPKPVLLNGERALLTLPLRLSGRPWRPGDTLRLDVALVVPETGHQLSQLFTLPVPRLFSPQGPGNSPKFEFVDSFAHWALELSKAQPSEWRSVCARAPKLGHRSPPSLSQDPEISETLTKLNRFCTATLSKSPTPPQVKK